LQLAAVLVVLKLRLAPTVVLAVVVAAQWVVVAARLGKETLAGTGPVMVLLVRAAVVPVVSATQGTAGASAVPSVA
jgi:hypothetical protein